jgi:mannose-6-phosphate isomerase-like protein (cupin superfamily)
MLACCLWLRAATQRRQLIKLDLMSTPDAFPYETRLNILHQPLELIDEKALADACTFKWYNQTLCQVNESVVRMAVVEGEYHWHKHDEDDEFFYVIEGCFLIDLEGRTIELAPRQGVVIPKGVVHRTRALSRTVILMVENKGIIPTGD